VPELLVEEEVLRWLELDPPCVAVLLEEPPLVEVEVEVLLVEPRRYRSSESRSRRNLVPELLVEEEVLRWLELDPPCVAVLVEEPPVPAPAVVVEVVVDLVRR